MGAINSEGIGQADTQIPIRPRTLYISGETDAHIAKQSLNGGQKLRDRSRSPPVCHSLVLA